MAKPDTTAFPASDLFYLRSILGNLAEYRVVTSQLINVRGFGCADEALADNQDWLECFINRHLISEKPFRKL